MKFFRYILPAVALAMCMNSVTLAADNKGDIQRFNGINGLKLPEWQVKATHSSGKLLLSDSPEMVPEDGITYQDTVDGEARLFFHHVNATDKPKKIVVLFENSGDKPANITVTKFGLGGPGLDYLAIGKEVQMEYFADNNLYLVEVPAGGSQQLSTELADAVVQNNELVNGMYDFKTDRPVKVSVMMLPADADAKEFAKTAKVLPADQWRLRGTFEGADRLLVSDQAYNPKKDGPVAITLADNKLDKYVTGIDKTDGSMVLNYGNYGVVYKMFIPSSYDGKIAYHLNPRGGEYAGGIGLHYQHQFQTVVPTPEKTTSFGSTIKDFAYIGTFDGGQSLWLSFSPPGASNLPVKLVLAPDEGQ
ncbi:hypothetical protein SDC9_13597 [bioreactor metagenome]|uniref:Uncharacterized protein n=1 Tax=bioreactor metagenome TaxID=1076179 RepID=A0A644TLZ1_9ZZZZ|nr:copper amine oxidase [Negativicutes bacterium]